MKTIISEPQLTSTIELTKVLQDRDYSFIGYESAGGLRTMFICHNGLYGFTYYRDETQPYRKDLKFAAHTAKQSLLKAIRSGRQLVITKNPSEFTQWFSRSKTVEPALDIIEIMRKHEISFYDLLIKLRATESFRIYNREQKKIINKVINLLS